MAILTLADAHLAYGHVALLDGASLSLQAGERVALIGRNGSGKSSLLKVVAGLERADDGELQVQAGLTRVYVAQEPEFAADATVFDAVADGVAAARSLRERYEQLAQRGHGEREDDAADADALDALQTQIDALGGWHWEQRVAEALQRLALNAAAPVAALSGGTKKRVALARALVAAPDLLLLDEPTNHLDIDTIEWLQGLLAERRGTLVFVSHDRAFIDALATRIVELDRGALRSYPGAFAAYEAAKERELVAAALADARADKLLAQEEVWVRQGVEARRTRSVGRVARLEALRAQRAARRDVLGRVRLELASGAPSGRVVAELDGVGLRHGNGPLLVEDFSATVLRGDRVGLIGPNGSGKTSLLKLILGELAPTTGRVRRGTRLQVAYFDQLRSALDLDATVADAISPGGDWIDIDGRRKHVVGYLGDFLFAPARARSPVRTLSGGERSRLLLARLFALPTNVLVLDEPTNDLDIDTLELLEEKLQRYAGTVFLVSHDRRFLDHVVTSTIACENDPAFGGRPGLWREYEGGYSDWQRQRARAAVEPAKAAPAAPSKAMTPATATRPSTAARAKLGYKEQRELDALPQRIEALEAEQRALAETLAASETYIARRHDVGALNARHAAIDAELTAALERWEALESRRVP